MDKKDFKVSTKHLLQIFDSQSINVHPKTRSMTLPKLKILSLALKGVLDSEGKKEELLAISIVINNEVDLDGSDKLDPKLFF